MEATAENTIQVKRRIIFAMIVLPALFGDAAFLNILGEPQFQSIRNIDMVRLIAIGACWGAAIFGAVLLMRSRFRKS